MTRFATKSEADADLRAMLKGLDPTSSVSFAAIEPLAILYDPGADEFKPWWVGGIFDIEQLLWYLRGR